MISRRRFLVMMGAVPVAVAAARFLPEQPKPQNDYVGALTHTVEFTTSHRFEPGDIIRITGTRWEGTYRMNRAGTFELLEKA
jgi:hypothetical protein